MSVAPTTTGNGAQNGHTAIGPLGVAGEMGDLVPHLSSSSREVSDAVRRLNDRVGDVAIRTTERSWLLRRSTRTLFETHFV